MTSYTHGGDIYGLVGPVLDFSANQNPLGMPPAVAEAARRAVEEAGRYPDSLCRDLRRAIGAYRREIAPMLPRCRTHLLTPPPLRTGLRTGDDGRKTTLTGRGCACLVEDGTRAVLMVYGLPELPPALPAPWDGAVLTPLLGGAPLGWTDLPLEAGRAAVYSLTMP